MTHQGMRYLLLAFGLLSAMLAVGYFLQRKTRGIGAHF
jgi:hypothetical protein